MDQPYKLNFSSIYDEEETDNFILSIRENIMTNVALEIDRIDCVHRTIGFIVEIGCDALWRMLNIEFIRYTPCPNFMLPAWKGDCSMEPSPKDTYAAKSIPIVSLVTKQVETDEKVQKVCECCLGIKCECLLPPNKRDLEQLLALEEAIEVEVENPEIEEYLNSLAEEEEKEESESSVESNLKVSSIVEEAPKSPQSSKSELSSDDEKKKMRCVLSEGFSKLAEKKKQISLPVLNVTHPVRAVSLTGMVVELPPIRSCIKTECHTVKEAPKTLKKKNVLF